LADQLLAERPVGAKLTVKISDSNIEGIQGEINAHEIQLCISSAMVYHTIKNHLQQTLFWSLLSHKAKFMYWSEEEQRDIYDGLILLKVITEVINPDVMIDCKVYKDELKSITLKSQGNNVRNLFSRMDTLQQRIQDKKGESFTMTLATLKTCFVPLKRVLARTLPARINV